MDWDRYIAFLLKIGLAEVTLDPRDGKVRGITMVPQIGDARLFNVRLVGVRPHQFLKRPVGDAALPSVRETFPLPKGQSTGRSQERARKVHHALG